MVPSKTLEFHYSAMLEGPRWVFAASKPSLYRAARTVAHCCREVEARRAASAGPWTVAAMLPSRTLGPDFAPFANNGQAFV
jgi:hypothetical protein